MKKINDLTFYQGWISESGDITPDLKYQFVQKNDGILQLNLVIDDHVSIDLLINNFKKIKEVRKKLIDFRGNNYLLFENSLTYQLLEIKNKYSKRPYKTIQFDLNFNLLMYIFMLFDETRSDEVHETNKKAVDYYLRSTLNYFNFTPEETEGYLEEFKESLNDKRHPPWGLSNGLIEISNVREKLKYQQKLIYNFEVPNTGSYYFNQLHNMLLISGYFHKTINFLQSNYPKDWAFYKNRSNDRLIDLINFSPKLVS